MEFALSLGSNLGDRLAFLQSARARISSLPAVTILAQAPVYETEPVGVEQPYAGLCYLNTVLIFETARPVEDLHKELKQIEIAFGRVRGAYRFAPRTLDIDILYAGDTVQNTLELTVPHPRWAQRRFVLQPLSDVRPDVLIPGSRLTVRECLAALPSGESVRLVARAW